jgi:hypothetical protein
MSQNEITFLQKYKNMLNQASAYLKLYKTHKVMSCICQAWWIYWGMHQEIEKAVLGFKEIFLTNVSPKLLDCKNS